VNVGDNYNRPKVSLRNIYDKVSNCVVKGLGRLWVKIDKQN